MGACLGGSRDPQDRSVQRELDASEKLSQQESKLLLLGPGGSGKSTLFKQLQYIHGDGFPSNKRELFKKQIYEQLLESMKILISQCEEHYEDDPERYAKYKLYDYDIDDDDDKDDIRCAAELILFTRNNQKLSKQVLSFLLKLWNHSTIQLMYCIRNEICVPDSTQYFYNEFNRITADGYIPTDKDLLMVRYRTSGMIEKVFVINGHKFKICDVGGQRNERRKWVHFFTAVTAVIFVISLSCYDELTFEDENENAMGISVKVFDEQVNGVWFESTPFIVFLNKSDLFYKKITKVSISVAECFKEYHGALNDSTGALTYIKEIFKQINKNEERDIFIHVTNATDKDQIEKVFHDVQTMIIDLGFQNVGLNSGMQ